MTHKVLISDTMLRSFIPPNDRKMTPRLYHICRCEICIIPKDLQIHLSIFRTEIVTDLQHNYVGINTHNSEYITTNAAHYREKVFPCGEFYMLLSKMQLSASPVLLLNQII